MVCRAVTKANGDNVDRMISALEGWQFVGPKGVTRIRKADHAKLKRDVAEFIRKAVGNR